MFSSGYHVTFSYLNSLDSYRLIVSKTFLVFEDLDSFEEYLLGICKMSHDFGLADVFIMVI